MTTALSLAPHMALCAAFGAAAGVCLTQHRARGTDGHTQPKEKHMYPTLFSTAGVKAFAEAIDAERGRQLTKFGEQHHPDGTGLPIYEHAARRYRDQADRNAESGVLAWRDVLLEEVYEALAESDPAKLRAELIQVAAVCAAWIYDLDSRPTA